MSRSLINIFSRSANKTMINDITSIKNNIVS